jgi:hypothetical protein
MVDLLMGGTEKISWVNIYGAMIVRGGAIFRIVPHDSRGAPPAYRNTGSTTHAPKNNKVTADNIIAVRCQYKPSVIDENT